jgi:hypothetical protein
MRELESSFKKYLFPVLNLSNSLINNNLLQVWSRFIRKWGFAAQGVVYFNSHFMNNPKGKRLV